MLSYCSWCQIHVQSVHFKETSLAADPQWRVRSLIKWTDCSIESHSCFIDHWMHTNMLNMQRWITFCIRFATLLLQKLYCQWKTPPFWLFEYVCCVGQGWEVLLVLRRARLAGYICDLIMGALRLVCIWDLSVGGLAPCCARLPEYMRDKWLHATQQR